MTKILEKSWMGRFKKRYREIIALVASGFGFTHQPLCFCTNHLKTAEQDGAIPQSAS